MKRSEALEVLYPDVKDDIVVTIMGAVAVELYSLGHRPNFFYLQHAMGLASSMGLGLALSKPNYRVTVLDGDGSVLMNLGTFSTLAWYAPRNLTHVVFDSESLLSVGGFPTATSAVSDIAGIARSSDIVRTRLVRTTRELQEAWDESRSANELTTIVAKVDASGPASFAMDINMLENRFEFERWLREVK